MNLNPQQELAVKAPFSPLLIVAGAGTGKTRTLTSRIVYLIESGVPANKICALTFTNKAAKEMADRVGDPKNPNSIRIPRKNLKQSIANSDHSDAFVDWDCNFKPFIGTFHSLGARILRAEARFLKRTANFVIFDDHDSFQLVKKIIKGMETKEINKGPAFFLEKISQLKSGMLSRADFEDSACPHGKLLLKISRRYEEALERNNAFDFDDLILKVIKVFKTQPAVLKKYQRRFPHLLIDEYQDLNNPQYELIRLLAHKTKTISVVGDDQQTIYSWRGSNFEIFLNFENDWPEAQVMLLEENYRSTKNIISAARTLIANNKRQKPKTLWTKNEAGPLIKIFEAADEEEEAGWIAEKIRNEKSETRNETVAILYRTNAQSRAMEQALIEREIPYRIFGGIKFYERREIKDIVAALRLAQNPKDEVSRERLQKTFSKNIFEALNEKLLNEKGLSPPGLINLFLGATNYFEYLEKNFPNPEERRENIGELIYFAAQFRDLSLFLEQISLIQTTDIPANSAKGRFAVSDSLFAVNLMTIHLAKGLEFDNVFIAGCGEGILPHNLSLDSDAGLEEERRLMYVAMTRAKKRLYASFYDQPSRFLFELPQDLIQFQSSVSDEKFLRDNEERYITID
jgi:DNA helicase-2/ATP-dependent DNA helicase PcrA